MVESSEFLISVPHFSKIMVFWVMGVPGCVEGQRWVPCGGARRKYYILISSGSASANMTPFPDRRKFFVCQTKTIIR